jgi:hypothetical protein
VIWPFDGAKEMGTGPLGRRLLTVSLDDEELCSIHAEEVPVERRPVVELSRTSHLLRFTDSASVIRSYDVSSVYEEGGRFLHLSVRVGPTSAAQADAVSTKDGQNPDKALAHPDGIGLRFQPFYLPESSSDPADLVGRGLFYRGLHFPGTVTRGNVSLLCICDHCAKSFRLQSFHAGFGYACYLYCSQAPHTLVASSYIDDAPPVMGKADPQSVARFEERLPRCSECGGEFRYMNPFRCPHCREPYIDFPRYPEDREREYYGNHLYGDTPQHWDPKQPT